MQSKKIFMVYLLSTTLSILLMSSVEHDMEDVVMDEQSQGDRSSSAESDEAEATDTISSIANQIKAVFGQLCGDPAMAEDLLRDLSESVFNDLKPEETLLFKFLYDCVPNNFVFRSEVKFNEFKSVILKNMKTLGQNKQIFELSFSHKKYKQYSLSRIFCNADLLTRIISGLELKGSASDYENAFSNLIEFLIYKPFITPKEIFQEFIKYVKPTSEPKISDKIRIRSLFISFGFDSTLEFFDSDRALLFKDSSGFPLLPDPDRQGRIVVIPGKIINIEKILEAETKFGEEINRGLAAITKMRADLFEASSRGANISVFSLIEAVPGFDGAFLLNGDVSNFLDNLNFPLSNESRIKLHEKFQEWFSQSNNKVVSYMLFIECIETIMNVNLMNLMLKDITKYTS